MQSKKRLSFDVGGHYVFVRTLTWWVEHTVNQSRFPFCINFTFAMNVYIYDNVIEVFELFCWQALRSVVTAL